MINPFGFIKPSFWEADGNSVLAEDQQFIGFMVPTSKGLLGQCTRPNTLTSYLIRSDSNANEIILESSFPAKEIPDSAEKFPVTSIYDPEYHVMNYLVCPRDQILK